MQNLHELNRQIGEIQIGVDKGKRQIADALETVAALLGKLDTKIYSLEERTRTTPIRTSPNTYNISEEVWQAGVANRGLEAISTGGGLDYVSRDFGNGRCLVCSRAEDAGSPTALAEPCCVTLYLSGDWDSGVIFEFRSTVEGLDFMKRSNIGFLGTEKS